MELVYELYDGVKYTEEIAQMATAAYMFNNPFLKPLKLKKQDLYNEFLTTLKLGTFKYVYVYFDKATYGTGNREIVGCMMWGDVIDFLPQGEHALVTDYSKVPTGSLVRQYMRHRTLQPMFQKYQPKRGEIAYGSGFGINPKFMGLGSLSYQMFKLAMEHIHNVVGYQWGSGHCINDIAKRVFEKSTYQDKYEIDVSDTYVIDSKEMPFVGMELSQLMFIGPIKGTIIKMTELLKQKANL